MISGNEIAEIINIYEKHGWVLRRVLLSAPLSIAIGDETVSKFGDVRVVASDLDAAWFSRKPSGHAVAWELRHLSENPYALLESFDESAADLEDSLRRVEDRLREVLSSKR